MPQQNPANRKDNKKSTSTSAIAPGSPLWNAEEHNQKSYGQGYDDHDPVGLLKGDVLNPGGGYSSGNSVSKFGTFTFKQQKHSVTHGQILELPLLRKGGSQSTETFIFELDRLTGDAGGGVYFDENTAVLGNFNSSVKDGFNRCSIDVDIDTLNTDPCFTYNSDTEQLSVVFDKGVEEIIIRVVIPYRTDINSLNPAILVDTLTYRVDEYQLFDAVARDIPMKASLKPNKACLAAITEEYKVKNHSAIYTVYSLPLPYAFIEGVGGKPAPIEQFNNTVVRHSYDDVDITIGKTRTTEAEWKYSEKPGTVNTIACSALFDTYPTSNFGQSRVITKDGRYTDALKVNWHPISGNPVNGLSAVPADVVYTVDNDFGQFDADLRSGVEAININVGDNPNVKFTLPSVDPGGDSQFKYFPEPFDLRIPTGNQFKIGDQVWTMFTAAGINASQSLNNITAYKIAATDTHSMSTYGIPHASIAPLRCEPDNSPIQPGWQISNSILTGGTFNLSLSTSPPAPRIASITLNHDALSADIVNKLTAEGFTATVAMRTAVDHISGGADITFTSPKTFGGPLSANTDNLLFDPLNFKLPTVDSFAGKVGKAPSGLSHCSLSAMPGIAQITTGTSIPKAGVMKYDDWLTHDNSNTNILYDVSSLVHPVTANELNIANLRGYYMSCNDHRPRIAYFKLWNETPEPQYDVDIVDLVVSIDKNVPYSVVTHSGYDDTILPQYVMKHDTGNTKSFESGKTWTEAPTGENLLSHMFSPYATWTETVTPPFTGYTTSGPVSADDIYFISLVPGVIPGATSTPPTNQLPDPPALTIDPVSPIADPALAGNPYTKGITYTNTGGSSMTLAFANNLHDIVADNGETWSWTFSGFTGGAHMGMNGYILPATSSVGITYNLTALGGIAGDIINGSHLHQIDAGGYGITSDSIIFNITTT